MIARPAGSPGTGLSEHEQERAEAAAALAEYREWVAAGRPGAISHQQARRLLLRHDGDDSEPGPGL